MLLRRIQKSTAMFQNSFRKTPSLNIVLGHSEEMLGYPQRQGVLGTKSFTSLYIPYWMDASWTSRATISGGSCFNALTVGVSDICLFVADSFNWTGHYKLWLSGVHHQDISPFNLMYKWWEDSMIVGVLNDFDLSILHGTNTKQTGTMLFMLLDMLSSIIADTHPLHLYWYDVESFL